MRFEGPRVELATRSAVDACPIAGSAFAERSAHVSVLAAENSSKESELLAKDLVIYGLYILADRDRCINICKNCGTHTSPP